MSKKDFELIANANRITQMSRITMTDDLNAAIHHMIAVGNDYVSEPLDDDHWVIVNRFDGTAALMDTHGSCNMHEFTLLEVL